MFRALIPLNALFFQNGTVQFEDELQKVFGEQQALSILEEFIHIIAEVTVLIRSEVALIEG